MKKCTRCGEMRALGDYFKSPKAPDKLLAICKHCKRARDSAKYRECPERHAAVSARRNALKGWNRRLMQRYKSWCGCRLCGEKAYVALDLHHVDMTTKEENPSKLVAHTTKRLKAEIRKCVVLCATCHRKVHAGLLSI